MNTKNEILEYVMRTPGNTNRSVLASLLDNLESDIEMPEITTRDVGRTLEVVSKPRVLIPAQTINISDSSGEFAPGFDTTGFTDTFEASCELITVDNESYVEVSFEWFNNTYLRSYLGKSHILNLYPDGRAKFYPVANGMDISAATIEISDIVTTFGSTEVKLQWGNK